MDEHHSIYVEMVDTVEGSVIHSKAILQVTCSCGFEVQARDKKREDATDIIIQHRLAVIEEKLDIKLEVSHIL